MYYAYIIENKQQSKYYVGITSNPEDRWKRHQSNARSTSKNPRYNSYLYTAMRKHGIENFTFEVVKAFKIRELCEQFEVSTIRWFNDNNVLNYNLHAGGTLGCDMREHPNYHAWKAKLTANAIGNATGTKANTEWKAKLRKARAGRTPALGMKHSDENKQFFTQVSQDYWATQDTYLKDAVEILKLSHREAKKQYGVSTTHYYRLKKRFATNDSK